MAKSFYLFHGKLTPALEPPEDSPKAYCKMCGGEIYDFDQDGYETPEGELICSFCAWTHGYMDF